MINRLWNWLDRHLDPDSRTSPAPQAAPEEDPDVWARQQWKDYEAGDRWRLLHAPNAASCPACYETQDIANDRHLAKNDPRPAERARWERNLADHLVARAALGDCRCGYRLTDEDAAGHAARDLREYLEGVGFGPVYLFHVEKLWPR